MLLEAARRKRYHWLFYGCGSVFAWAFFGAERLVGDHERGVVWEPFIKHRASFQVRFLDPSRHGLETVPYENLDRENQMQFVEFCDIRYGVRDPKECRAMTAARDV
jgi:hypothetical protein